MGTDELCDAADHWVIGVSHELADGTCLIRYWRICPNPGTDEWLASFTSRLGEPLREQMVSAEEAALHQEAHENDPHMGITIGPPQELGTSTVATTVPIAT